MEWSRVSKAALRSVAFSVSCTRTHTCMLEVHTADKDELLVSNVLRYGVSNITALQEGMGHHSQKGNFLLTLVLPNPTNPPFPQTLN